MVNNTVIIRITSLNGYLQGLVSGVAKSPNEGYSVMSTFEKGKAKRYQQNSEELQHDLQVLEANHVQYEQEIVES